METKNGSAGHGAGPRSAEDTARQEEIWRSFEQVVGAMKTHGGEVKRHAIDYLSIQLERTKIRARQTVLRAVDRKSVV